MAKQIEEIPLVNFNSISADSEVPLYKQLYELLRKAILESRLKPGQKLPGTRELAAELRISRNTVAIAFDQLRIEGYISGRTGSGTFVNEIPDKTFSIKKGLNNKTSSSSSEKYQREIALHIDKKLLSPILLQRNIQSEEGIPFQNGLPALDEFPIHKWNKIFSQTLNSFPSLNLGYGEAAGFKPLRESVTSYLNSYRAVNCTADQVIIVNGSQQGLDLIARVLLNPGDNIWLEDPAYFGIRASMLSAKTINHACPLDEEGLNIAYAIKHYPRPKLIYTTPSHQFPLGLTMSISRRLQLLNYAKKNNSWIIEDDYDSEFRYVGNPLPSLQGMDEDRRVLYLGTFSKVLFPGIRLGYLVLPDAETTKIFIAMKSIMDRQSPILEQAAVAAFIKDGYFTKHIRKMRMLYKSRQEYLINEIKNKLGDKLKVSNSAAGMHLIGWLPAGKNDKIIAEELFKHKIIASPVSDYVLKFKQNPGLILGYTAFNEEQIKKAVNIIQKVL